MSGPAHRDELLNVLGFGFAIQQSQSCALRLYDVAASLTPAVAAAASAL